MKTIALIFFMSLSHFSLFGQSIDSLLLGTWSWAEKGENTVILKRSNEFKYYPMSLRVYKTDTLYRSMITFGCGNTPRRNRYKLRRGIWHFDSNGLFVIQYEDSPIRFPGRLVEKFEVIDSTSKKITLRKVPYSENETTD